MSGQTSPWGLLPDCRLRYRNPVPLHTPHTPGTAWGAQDERGILSCPFREALRGTPPGGFGEMKGYADKRDACARSAKKKPRRCARLRGSFSAIRGSPFHADSGSPETAKPLLGDVDADQPSGFHIYSV